MESDIVSGQQSAWVLLKKLGEGDAGEVYLVESLLEKRTAILKRPVRSAFASDIIRQTTQITTEGKILRAVGSALRMDEDFSVTVPELIDQSKSGTAYSERLFIIIEKARGFDLSTMAKAARQGSLDGISVDADTPEENRFLQDLARAGLLPERVVLSALSALLGLFERVHSRAFEIDGVQSHGILWNDVKAEHLYWDPWRAQLTIIDWGNAQFLEQDGTTRDRRFTAIDDYRQLIEEMGRFLDTHAPALRKRLDWPKPTELPYVQAQPSGLVEIQTLREHIWDLMQQQIFELQEARAQETALLHRGADETNGSNPLTELEAIHLNITQHGELPDYEGALNLALTCAARFSETGQFAEIEETCEWGSSLPGGDADHMRLVAELARITSRSQTVSDLQQSLLREAVRCALRRDWPTVLWNLVSALQNGMEPNWWLDLLSTIRRQELGAAAGDVMPMLFVRRALLTLQSMAEKMERSKDETAQAALFRLLPLVNRLREEVIPKWLHFDPSPPFSNLSYDEIDQELEEIGAFLPEARTAIDRALAQPRAHVLRVLANWDRGDFDGAIEGLRYALLWDPDRKRVLRARQAMLDTPAWLTRVQAGPREGEHYQSFITDIEFEGRELRNQIGPASWLDLILEGCRNLRRGAWPPDLFSSMPLLVKEMPWLRKFERRERLPAVAMEGEPQAQNGSCFTMLNSSARGKIGIDQDLHLHDPLDYWVAEARGSSARVFAGSLRDAQGTPVQTAIKLMRMDKVEYSLPLFREEVLVLNAMCDVPGVPGLYECGFIKFDNGRSMPVEREGTVDPSLTGSLVRIGPVIGQEYINQLESRISDGWTPYLALELRDSKDNLLRVCDASMTAGVYLPVSDLLQISIQICEILQEAHNRNIVYRDHKILHYYWIEDMRGVYSIDWNVARLHTEGLSAYEKQMDMVQFGARALHHILTGRTAPGALPLGPTRPDEIEQAAKSYEAQWTYDDQRLPEDLRRILERVLAGEYNSAIQLRDELKSIFLNLPDL